MGRWKYINWLLVVIILGHMYYYMSARYEAPVVVYVLATAGWLVIAMLGYYIYAYRIDRSGRRDKNTLAEAPRPKTPATHRPKVTFKKKG